MRSADLTECDDVALLPCAGKRSIGVRRFVRRHQFSALRVAAVISGSTEEAKDIVQDAFVNVHRKLDSYRGTGSVRSWLLRVVANHAKNHVRSRIRRIRLRTNIIRAEKHLHVTSTVAHARRRTKSLNKQSGSMTG